MDRRLVLSGMAAITATAFVPWKTQANSGHKLLGYVRTNWSCDPFSFGSYSYVAKGSSRRDIRRLGKPVGSRLFFSGEALHHHYNSTVHAAYESGIQTAQTVLETDHQKIAIVGAGISGLAAAQLLANAGRHVSIFEGRDRIGGRIWTSNKLGTQLDLGASWIHSPDGNPLSKLADRAGQQRIETDDSYIVRGKNGRRINEGDVPDWLEKVTEVQHSAGANSDQINSWAYLSDEPYGGSDVTFPLGYSDIFKTLAGEYSTQLSHIVTAVSLQKNNVTLAIKDRKAQNFDAVVVTVPLGVLKKGCIEFDPPLSEKKQKAIERLGMGTLDKVYLLFEEPFWDKETWIATPENNLPEGQFNQWLNFHRYIKKPIIMAFNGGPPALSLAKENDDTLVKKALQTLDLAYPV